MTPAAAEIAPADIWTEPVDRLLTRLATTPNGLTTAEAKSRLALIGPNDAATTKRTPA